MRGGLSRMAMVIGFCASSACSGEYTPPARAVAQDMAAISAGGGGTTHLTRTTTFRDSDLSAPR